MAEVKINFGNIGVNESFKWKSNEFKKVNSRNAKVIGKNQIYMFNIHDIVIKELVEKKMTWKIFINFISTSLNPSQNLMFQMMTIKEKMIYLELLLKLFDIFLF